MAKRRGLPGELERETIEAVRAIYLKYVAMKKKHMTPDHIRGVMIFAFGDAFKKEES